MVQKFASQWHLYCFILWFAKCIASSFTSGIWISRLCWMGFSISSAVRKIIYIFLCLNGKWQFSFNFDSLPFNTEAMCGFYIELFAQMFTVHFYMLILACVVSIFNTFHTFINGFIADFSMTSDHDKCLRQKTEMNLIKQNQSNRIDSAVDQLETRRFLRDVTELHVGIVQ